MNKISRNFKTLLFLFCVFTFLSTCNKNEYLIVKSLQGFDTGRFSFIDRSGGGVRGYADLPRRVTIRLKFENYVGVESHDGIDIHFLKFNFELIDIEGQASNFNDTLELHRFSLLSFTSDRVQVGAYSLLPLGDLSGRRFIMDKVKDYEVLYPISVDEWVNFEAALKNNDKFLFRIFYLSNLIYEENLQVFNE